jgi:hypothetical protein
MSDRSPTTTNAAADLHREKFIPEPTVPKTVGYVAAFRPLCPGGEVRPPGPKF